MNPGETIRGLDFQNHLWVVLSLADARDDLLLVNFTSHNKSSCGPHCIVVLETEYAAIDHASCVYYRGMIFNARGPLMAARENGSLIQDDPLPAEILRRVQRGALASRFLTPRMEAALRQSSDP